MAVHCRPCETTDIAAMARIRSREWGAEEYWAGRISRYLAGEAGPQHALAPRACFVAAEEGCIIGFAAGHLTRRFGCTGELQWINIVPERRRVGVASSLLGLLATWFAGREAFRVCVDVEPENGAARAFYTRHGAEPLKRSWMVWSDIRRATPAALESPGRRPPG